MDIKDFTHIKQLEEVGKTYNLIAKVISTKEKPHDKINQAGIIRDKSGKINYTIWESSNQPKLEKGKVYILKDIKLSKFGKYLNIHINDYSSIELYSSDKFTSDLEKEKEDIKKQRLALDEERKLIEKQKQQVENQSKDFIEKEKRVKRTIELNKQAFIEAEEKKQELANLQTSIFLQNILKFTVIFACLLVIVYVGYFIYDYSSRTALQKDDIIEVETAEKNIPFKVIEYDKKQDLMTAVSLDTYEEKITFKRLSHLEKVAQQLRPELKEHIKKEQSKIYSYNTRKYKDHVAPDIKSVIIRVNTEKNDSILMKLPGIGSQRVQDLKNKRPFYSIEDVLDAHIGIGDYWGTKWEEGISKGSIVFE